MIYSAILIACVFLLLAFLVEKASPALGLPSVIVLVVLGFLAKPALALFGHALDGLDVMVPIIGTVGLVLIVLEGALDITLQRDRMPLVGSAFTLALLGFLLNGALIALLGYGLLALPPVQAVMLAVPFAVISSAVAIPSSQFLPSKEREFVVYESSLSDILGVLVFFALINAGDSLSDFWLGLMGGGLLSLLLAIVCAAGLVLLLMRIEGHIRFVPLLAGLFGLYAIGKLLHLSPLIMVLFFGLMLNNPRLVARVPYLRNWIDESYATTLNEFKVLVQELTFAVRGFFFILLGYWTDFSDFVPIQAWVAAGLVLLVIYGGRYLMFRIFSRASTTALWWIAPRGLITVLLFIIAKEKLTLPGYLNGAAVIVVLASTAIIIIARRNFQKEQAASGDGGALAASQDK